MAAEVPPTMTVLRLAEPELTNLLSLLESRYPNYEWATFLRLGWRETADGLILTLADLCPPAPGELDEDVGHVAIDEPRNTPDGARSRRTALQIFGSRSKYSSSSFLPPCPSPTCVSDSMKSMRSIHLTIL